VILVTTVKELREPGKRNILSRFFPLPPFVAVVEIDQLELSRCSLESSIFGLTITMKELGKTRDAIFSFFSPYSLPRRGGTTA
jgi:hypothetical protein